MALNFTCYQLKGITSIVHVIALSLVEF